MDMQNGLHIEKSQQTKSSESRMNGKSSTDIISGVPNLKSMKAFEHIQTHVSSEKANLPAYKQKQVKVFGHSFQSKSKSSEHKSPKYLFQNKK